MSCGMQMGQLELKKFQPSVPRPMCTKSPRVWATGLAGHGEVPFFVLTAEALRLCRYAGFDALDDLHVVAWPVSDTQAQLMELSTWNKSVGDRQVLVIVGRSFQASFRPFQNRAGHLAQ